MRTQVFISYSHQDSAVAESIHDALEQAGIPAWLAHRDLTAGVSWSQRIVDEIHASRVLILILSRHANDSRYVIREVAEAVDSQTAIVTVRIEDIAPSNALKFFIAAEQWLDAFNSPAERYQRRLIDDVRLLLGVADAAREESVAPNVTASRPLPTTAARRGPRLFLQEHKRAVRATLVVLAATAAVVTGMRVLPLFASPVVIATRAGEVLVGDTVVLELDSDHDAAAWTSSNPQVLTISPDARVSRAIGEGHAWLIATVGSRSDSIAVTVKRPLADSISIVAPQATIPVGDSLELAFSVYDRAARQIAAPQLQWSTDAPRIAAVSEQGVVDGIAPGRARITARVDSVSATVVVIVAARSTRLPELRDSPARSEISRPNVGVALPTEEDLTGAANLCLEAVRKPDIEWISANYRAPTPADQTNLDRLTTMMRQPRYTVTSSGIGSIQPESRSADFWAQISYTASFGRTVRARGMFRVLTENSTGSWRLASCRIVGSITTS